MVLNLHRRRVLQGTIGLFSLVVSALRPEAQTYPTRPVHLIVGFPPGGAGDAIARIVAVHLSERLGQRVIVEYRPGAGTNIATRQMLSSPADGHTLLLIGSSSVVNALLHERDQPGLLKDIVLVAGLTVSSFVIVVNSATPQMTLADLVACAKADPGKIRAGTYGIGTQSHLAAQIFCKYAEVDITLVPYRGSALMMNDLLGQHIEIAFDSVGSALPHIQSGALRPLAVTADKRLNRILPDVPAAKEVFPDYEVVTWTGLAVRKGTASHIVERLHHESTAIASDPIVGARLTDLTFDTMIYSRDELGAFWSEEINRTRGLVHDFGVNLL